MIVTTCDQCHAVIKREAGGWFGVDHVVCDDGVLVEPVTDHEFHFCSADCGGAWFFERSFSGPT